MPPPPPPGVMFGSATAKQDQRRIELLAEERRVCSVSLVLILILYTCRLIHILLLLDSSSGRKWLINLSQSIPFSGIDDL